ncbi:serine hydrolase [Nocardia sp. 2]|uniref:Serine hydrolase n=1 Tax=Nocardia acididurans TaxID=2802282 RepID=A0ABS1M828_9NOCA|nr:serine hydrolase [Nocardia acididurans]MBL1076797.1 serine hydrolase [Nocardia acididurans]
MSAAPSTRTAVQRIRAVFADAGCTGWVHARRCPTAAAASQGVPSERTAHATAAGTGSGSLAALGSAAEVDVDGRDRVVTASVYKLPLFLAFCRAVDAGRIDPCSRLTVNPPECTPGPTGLAALRDPVTLSRRDLAASMMTVSDNAAADMLLGEVGLAAIEELLAEIGLRETRIVGGTADVHRSLVLETDTHSTAEAFAALADNDEAWSVSAYDPSYASATTPEEMTRLLCALWGGQVLSAEQTIFAQSVMRQQVWQHRISSGFAHRGVSVAGKTGTIGVIRNEVAMVEFPGEYPIAVAVFTRAARADPNLPVVDAAIGEAARIAVTELRRPLDAE